MSIDWNKEEDFLRTIKGEKTPEERKTARLIFADWLEEQDPPRIP